MVRHLEPNAANEELYPFLLDVGSKVPSSKHTPGIVFLGDFCLSGEEILVALDRKRIDPWQGVRQTFLEDCLIIANLECPFTSK